MVPNPKAEATLYHKPYYTINHSRIPDMIPCRPLQGTLKGTLKGALKGTLGAEATPNLVEFALSVSAAETWRRSGQAASESLFGFLGF